MDNERTLTDMYNLQLSAEQQEIRDTVRDFVVREIKPVALHPDRLQAEDQFTFTNGPAANGLEL